MALVGFGTSTITATATCSNTLSTIGWWTPRESYMISDLGKCAVARNVARDTEALRYKTCFHWLEEELSVLSSNVIIAIGSLAGRALAARRSRLRDIHLFCVPHYSGANRGRLYEQLDGDWQRELPAADVLSIWYR
jgi:uracil-DNA glycosylase